MPVMPATAYRIKPGDTLSGIAQSMLGSAREWPRIYAFNNMPDVLSRGGARIADPDRIRAGDTIFLPLLGPSAPVGLRPTGPGAPSPAFGPLQPLIGSTAVPYAMAQSFDRQLLMIESVTHTIRVLVTCRFALAMADQVLLTTAIGKGYEFSSQIETRNAFDTLISDTSVSFDPKTRSVGVSNGLTTQSSHVIVPRTAIGVEFPRPGAMPVLRAEISYPELKGQVGRNAYAAANVVFAVEIEPKIPMLRTVPVLASVPSRMVKAATAFDWASLDSRVLRTALIATAIVATAIVIWPYLAVGFAGLKLASMAGLLLTSSALMAH